MAKFTASIPLNIRWLGNDISGAAGATHRIPDALYEEFNAAYTGVIPGLTWVTQDETSAIGSFLTSPIGQTDVTGLTASLAAKAPLASPTFTGTVTTPALSATGAIKGASVSTPSLTATSAVFNGSPWLDAKAFGATGDGVTDDTAALQSFITAAATSSLLGVIPSGTYIISSALTVPNLPSWGIAGVHPRSVTLKQATNNIPILVVGDTGGTYTHTWRISGLAFDYANVQSSSNTNAICIKFNRESFHGVLDQCSFLKGYYGIGITSGVGVPWGNTFDNLNFELGMTGGAINWTGAINAGPNNRFGRIWVDATSAVGPLFYVRGYNFVIDTIEMVQAGLGPKLFVLESGGVLEVGTMKLEAGTYTTSQTLFEFQVNDSVSIGHLYLGGTINVTGSSATKVTVANLGPGGGTSGRLHIGDITIAVSTSSSARAFAFAGAGTITADHIVLTNALLVDQASTAAGESVQVEEHVRRKLSSNIGDASYTATLGGPTIVSFETTFTASRTVDLPAVNDNLFNGLHYDFRFSGAINGANTAVIRCNAVTLLTQSTDKVVVGFTYRRSASGPQGGWILTRYETLP